MKRAFPKSPLTVHLLSALFLLVFSLTGAKSLTPGEIVSQEGVFYRTEGLQLQKMGELDRAAAAFRRAIYVKPDYAEAYNDLGVVLESLGNLEEAEEVYKTALRFKPNMGSAHSNLALLYEESNRVKEAAVHWAARVRLGPAQDPWVAAARERLAKYQIPMPEIAPAAVHKKDKEIRRMIETGGSKSKAPSFWSRIRAFWPDWGWGRRSDEFEVVADKKQVARKLKELEKARSRASDAERKARDAEIQWRTEMARRMEAESKAEKIEGQAAGGRNLKEWARARHQVEKATRRAEVAEHRKEAARKAADEARWVSDVASRSYQAAKQSAGPARRQTQEVVGRAEPGVSAVPPGAQALALEIAKEKSQVRGKASDDLTRRASGAMREGLYQDAIEIYKQILILEPGDRNAKQGLERAQKALAKQL